MALTQKTWKVLSFSEIPQELTENHWISEEEPNSYVEVHYDAEDEDGELDNWIVGKYPELKDEESFLIHMDY